MARRVLERSPALAPSYVRTAAAMLPGGSLLPGVPGAGGNRMPTDVLVLSHVRAEPARLETYERVCFFPGGRTLPATYPHVLAFPLHMRLMSSARFPFTAAGLVHIANSIRQERPIERDEPLELTVSTGPLHAHAQGCTFTIFTDARGADGQVIWREQSAMLRRGGPRKRPTAVPDDELALIAEPACTWPLLANLGRRYGAVSGDRNPIHLHRLTARAFGFPHPIAHGMWTKARALAQLQPSLPDAFTVAVRFRRPITLPGLVAFASAGTRFAVRDATDATTLHLDGEVQR